MSTPSTAPLFGFGRQVRPHHTAATDPYLDPAGMDELVAGMTRLRDDWPNLSEDARLERIQDLINPRLADAGVPPTVVEVDQTRRHGAVFDYREWSIRLGTELVHAPELDVNATAWLAEVTFHEGRHAQQWYDMARSRAGDGRSAGEIVAETGIHRKVARQAIKDPLAPNATGVEGDRRQAAQTHHHSIYDRSPTGGANHRNQVLAELDRLTANRDQAEAAYRQALATHGANPTTAAGATAVTQTFQSWAAAAREYKQKMPGVNAAYRQLPEEIDAWAAGGTAGQRSHRHQAQHPPRTATVTVTAQANTNTTTSRRSPNGPHPSPAMPATAPTRAARHNGPRSVTRHGPPHQRPPATRTRPQPGLGR
jgi:hypothetical protein